MKPMASARFQQQRHGLRMCHRSCRWRPRGRRAGASRPPGTRAGRARAGVCAGRPGRPGKQACVLGARYRAEPVRGPELPVQRVQVLVDGARRNARPASDHLGGQSRGRRVQHVCFARGQWRRQSMVDLLPAIAAGGLAQRHQEGPVDRRGLEQWLDACGVALIALGEAAAGPVHQESADARPPPRQRQAEQVPGPERSVESVGGRTVLPGPESLEYSALLRLIEERSAAFRRAVAAGHGRVRALAAARAIQRDGVPPELLRVRRPASRLDIPPRTIETHCQGAHSEESASLHRGAARPCVNFPAEGPLRPLPRPLAGRLHPCR